MKQLLILLLLAPAVLVAQNKVGIGTETPQAKLDISAEGDSVEILRFSTERPWAFKQTSSGINSRLTLQSLVDAKWFDIVSQNGLATAAKFHLLNAYSSVFLVPDGGEVGIGVNDASGKLHISHNSTGGFPQLRITEEDDEFGRIKFESSFNPGAYWDIAGKADTLTDDSKLNFFFSNNLNSGDRMTIRGNGNIGIGTTAPDAKLDIIGGNWNLEGGSPGDLRIGTAAYNLRVGIATGGGGAGVARIFTGGGIGSLFFGTNNARRMVIDSAGKIGIGLDNPSARLDVANTGDGARLLSLSTERPWVFKQRNTGSSTQLTLQTSTNFKSFVILSQDGTNQVADFFASNAGSGVYLVPDGGKVGIGTNTSANKVRVLGNTNTSEHVLSVSSAYSGNSNVRAIEGLSTPAIGYGVGGYFDGGARGIEADAHGTSSTGWAIAVEASAYGTAGTRIGLFGRAIGGNTNWAGYFAEGDVYVTNELRIGTGAINGASNYKVAVDGKIIAEEVRVQLSGDWPDYVFESNYDLAPLADVEKAILSDKHLPGIPSADEMNDNGLLLGDMQVRMMEKIEELTLYLIEQDKRIKELEAIITLSENK